MRFLSLFSGVEAASLAWLPLGWQCVGVSEIEPFPCAVLKHHYPDVPNLWDVTKITQEQIEQLGHIDVVIFGSPCQDFSVAGKRKGLKHEDGTPTRSGLFFDAARIADWAKARWTVVENVPGLFSSHRGRDFAAVVGELAGCEIRIPGDGWRNAGVALGTKGLVEWGVLDAQYFGVAQRRRRVFLVRDAGNWADRPPLFSLAQSLCGNPPPRRETREGIAPSIAARTRGGGGLGTDAECDGAVIPINMQSAIKNGAKSPNGNGIGEPGDPACTLGANDRHAIAATLRSGPTTKAAHSSRSGDKDENLVVHSLRAEYDASEDGTGRGTPIVPQIANCLAARDHKGSNPAKSQGPPLIPVATSFEPSMARTTGGQPQTDLNHALRADTNTGDGQPCVAYPLTKRAETDTFHHGHATETDAVKALRELRFEIGEKAFAEWGLGILASFLPQEILQQAVHVTSLRCPTIQEFDLVSWAFPRQETGAERFVRKMRESKRAGCSPFGWESAEQRAIQLAAYLSKLSHPPSSAAQILQDLRAASQGVGVLRNALSEVQEVGRPALSERQPVHACEERLGAKSEKDLQSSQVWEAVSRAWVLWETRHSTQPGKAAMAVRRLCVTECEFLQGFPRNYTLVPYRGKPAKDGPRYKAIGNSFAVPVIRWIGQQLTQAAQYPKE